MWPRIWARKISSVWFLGLEPVAADGSVGASEVARSPGLVQGTEGVGNVLRELGAGGGVDVESDGKWAVPALNRRF